MSAFPVLVDSSRLFSVCLSRTCGCNGVLDEVSHHCGKHGRKQFQAGKSVLAHGFRGLRCGQLAR